MSRREQQVARAYTSGKTYRQIADDLHIAPATVRTHINNIYRKLEVSSKIELLHRMEPSDAIPMGRSAPPRWLAPFGVALIAVAGVAYALMSPMSPSGGDTNRPTLSSMAVVVFSNNGDGVTRDELTRDLVDGLTQHAELFVIQPGDASRALSQEVYARQLSARLNMRFVLSGAARVDGDLWQVSTALFDRQQGRVIWTDGFRGTRPDGLTLRRDLIASLSEAVRLPATDAPTARCLEMTEHLAQETGGSPIRKIYQFQALGPRYCPGDASGPK